MPVSLDPSKITVEAPVTLDADKLTPETKGGAPVTLDAAKITPERKPLPGTEQTGIPGLPGIPLPQVPPSLWDKAKKLGGDLLESAQQPMTQTLHNAVGDGMQTASMKDSAAGIGEGVRRIAKKIENSGTVHLPILGDEPLGKDAIGILRSASFPLELADKGLQAAGGAIDFLTTPVGAGTLALPGAAPVVRNLAEAAIGTQMAVGAKDAAKKAYNEPSSENTADAMVNAGMAMLPVIHGVKRIMDLKGAPVAPGAAERLPSAEQADQATTAAANAAVEHIEKSSPEVAPTPQNNPVVDNPQQPEARLKPSPTSVPLAAPPEAAPPEAVQAEAPPAPEPVKPPVDEKLPRDLAGAKTNYNYGGKAFTVEFESDVDKAAYISAQNLPSRRDADYLAHVERVTGLSPNEIRAKGLEIKADLKRRAIDSEPGTLKVARTIERPAEIPEAAAAPPEPAAPPELTHETEPPVDEQGGDHAPEAGAPETLAPDQITEELPAEPVKPDVDPTRGKAEEVKTPAGRRVDTHFEVRPQADLIASHDTALNVNPEFPAEVQPRNRERAQSEIQITKLAGELDPRDLGSNRQSGFGSPIIGPDGVVETGNGRTIAIRRLYESGHENGVAYRQHLIDNAAEYGLDPEHVAGIKDPVLVRVRDTPMDARTRADFAREANGDTVMKMSAVEQAAVDSPKLVESGILKMFKPSEDGDITAASNRDFVRAFLQGISGDNEGNGLMAGDGKSLSQDGVARIRNAVFHAAYNDSATLAKLAESTDSNIKNITNGMLASAPDFAKLNNDRAEGSVYDIDLRPDITQAVERLSALRSEGVTLEQYLNQPRLTEDVTPEARSFLVKLDEYKRSKDKVSRLLDNISEAVRAIGDPRQEGMFGGPEVPTKGEILHSAIRETEAQLAKIEEDKLAKARAQGTLGLETSGDQAPASQQAGDSLAPPLGNEQAPIESGQPAEAKAEPVNERPVQSRGRRTGLGGVTPPPESPAPGKAPISEKRRKSQGGSVPTDLLTLGIGHFLRDDVMPTVKDAAKVLREAVDDWARVFAPAGRGEQAQTQGHIIREGAAELARRDDIVQAGFRVAGKFYDSQAAPENHAFMNRIETGQRQPDLHSQSIANRLAEVLTDRRKQVQALGTGKLQGFYENYFPHIWDDPAKAAEVVSAFFKANLEGSKAFLKERAVPTIQDGLNAGLKLASDNPVELVLRKVHEMDKYITAHHMMSDSQDAGLLHLVEANQELPAGFRFIEDPIARVWGQEEARTENQLKIARDAGQQWIGGDGGVTGGANPAGGVGSQGHLDPSYQGKPVSDPGAVAGSGLEEPAGLPVIAGRFAAPEPVARVFNNYLSPGLRERSGIFRAVLGVSNVLNQAQLGFSAFHLMFTSAEAAYSRFSLGIHQAAHGQIGAGLKTSLSTPLAPFTNIINGDKVLKEWYKPGSQGAEMGRIVDAVLKAGGRARMDGYYRTNMVEGMMKALRAGNLPGAVWRAPFAAVETAAKPIMEYIVPRQKLGVFADMARTEFGRLPENATAKDAQAAISRAWDSVDNRMGQMVYSNLFWHRVAKDIGMVSVRSMGWNLGTIREGLGGAKDLAGYAKDVLTPGKKADMSYRASYVVGAPMLMAAVGSIAYGLMHNGAPPPTVKDAFFPTNADGDRYNIPGYGKDVYEWSHDPLKTAKAKVNPLFPLVQQMVTNKDYFGHEIASVDDPLMQRVLDRSRHVAKAFQPFGAQKLLSDDASSTADKVLPFFGITRAPKSLDEE